LIASNIGGMRDIIVNGKTGILVPPNNSKKLSEAMDYLLKMPSIANEMGENGFRRFVRHYTSDVITSKIEKIYDNLYSKSKKEGTSK
jgi:glycosyltransferase involved in cell wall biosynthesis